jgi:hypothetical protein
MRFAVALPLLGLLVACSPSTTYRYSALTPAAHPLAWDGTIAKEGRLRLEGTLTRDALYTNLFPVLHDTALHVPSATLEGAATLAISRDVELGARYSYASYEWSQATATGTPPLPDHPHVSGFGPEIRIAIPLDRRRRFTLGLGGNLMNYTTPYSEWQICPCAPGSNVFVDTSSIGANTAYGLVQQGTETHWATNFAIYPSFNLSDDGRMGHVFGGISAHTAFKNDGFTDLNQSGSTIQNAGLVYFLALGYGASFEPIRVSALVALPLTNEGSPVNYAIAGFLSVGVDIPLWDGREPKDDGSRRDGAPPGAGD